MLTDCFRDITSLKWTLNHSQASNTVRKTLFYTAFCSAHLFWSRVFGSILTFWGTFPEFGIVGFSGFRTFGLAKHCLAFQTNLGMYRMRWGICRVHSDPQAPRGDRNGPIDAFSDFRSYGDTLTALPSPKVHSEWTKTCQLHAPSTWASGGPGGTS